MFRACTFVEMNSQSEKHGGTIFQEMSWHVSQKRCVGEMFPKMLPNLFLKCFRTCRWGGRPQILTCSETFSGARPQILTFSETFSGGRPQILTFSETCSGGRPQILTCSESSSETCSENCFRAATCQKWGGRDIFPQPDF